MFSGKRIRQAREVNRLTQDELARLIRKSQAAITHVEREFKEPSAELVSAIAQHTHFPVSFFANEPRAEFPLKALLFRSRSSARRRDAIAVARYAEIIFEMTMDLAAYVTTIPLRLERSAKSPVEAARESRRWLGLTSGVPVPHLINSMERAGIVVMAIPHPRSDIDAFSAWIDSVPIIALCAESKAGDRRRWSAAHELGHLVLHLGKAIRSDEHKQADEFAAELLLPEVAMRKEVRPPVTLTSLALMKPQWGVSIQALVYRSHELGIITDRQYRYLFEQLSIRGWRTNEPSNLDVPVEKPRALRKMVELVPFGADTTRLAAELRLDEEKLHEILSLYEDRSGPQGPTDERVVSSKVIRMRKG
ncbi:MAG TPA: XRE family transcriptional regulator [Candidatus Acidoferrales bacterium]|jgi:Zn-dependent peptidase ImmA (M78 family)/DNA-binding XRE family transcriptional regulator|nr:XRE family transcriptional regulator [Candidatus Acidoferrales bacterium]